MTAPSAIAAGTIELHIDIEGEDCWIKVAPSATTQEIQDAYRTASAAGLEEEEETIEFDAEGGWTAWYRFSPRLMRERGMV